MSKRGKSTPTGSKVPPRGSVPKPGTARPVRRAPSRTEAARQRRNRRLAAITASVAVVVVIVVLVVVKTTGGSSVNSEVRAPIAPATLSRVTGVPVGTLVTAANSAASGGVTVHPPSNLPPTATPLTSGGKPEILYVGAEYCPYCAAERWSMVMALSKFGTFSNLQSTKSSSTDVNPDTPTFTFVSSTYSSPYLTFTPVETEDRAGKPLQSLTTAQTNIAQTYDAPPYTSTPGSIPFIYLAGKYLVSGTQYDASKISGMSFDAAASYLTSGTNPTSEGAQAVAAHLIGVICSLTNNQPATVCSGVPASLKTGQSVASNQGSSSGG